ncbi:PREDICTED: collagen alpha-1(I) chain-like [Chinchilla lanigera]|uniref:collagen alpha-1(I) chain-like n=1 Tax=Chinchilla lanigera TaxID=34839 RepID=UPI000695BE26|nr:PREDICTED: collagen alpha-1(I) chain-like [Chinchilla lanigera]
MQWRTETKKARLARLRAGARGQGPGARKGNCGTRGAPKASRGSAGPEGSTQDGTGEVPGRRRGSARPPSAVLGRRGQTPAPGKPGFSLSPQPRQRRALLPRCAGWAGALAAGALAGGAFAYCTPGPGSLPRLQKMKKERLPCAGTALWGRGSRGSPQARARTGRAAACGSDPSTPAAAADPRRAPRPGPAARLELRPALESRAHGGALGPRRR